MVSFEGSTTTTQQAASVGPQSHPHLPRVPGGPGGQMSRGLSGGGHHQQSGPQQTGPSMGGHFPHHAHRQQSGGPGMGPGPGPGSFSMAPQSASPRGPPQMNPPGGVPGNPGPGQPPSPYQHQGPPPLHHGPQLSMHHPQQGQYQQGHPPQQPQHHPSMHHPQHMSHRSHHQQRPPSQPSQPNPAQASQASGSYPAAPASAPAGHHAQQQQQQFPSSGLNGDWQSDKDMQHRREMIQHIVKLLKQKDKNASPEWLNKLPQMVKQLEVSLYRSAPSFEAYADTSTLKHRLQLLAMEIARKTQQSKDGSSSAPNDSRRRPDHNPSQMHSQSNNRQRSNHGLFPGQSSQKGNVPMDNMQQRNPSMNAQSSSRPRSISASQRDQAERKIINANDINPMMGGQQGGMSNPFNSSSSNQATGRVESSSSSSHQNQNDPDWKIRIRHKQQRLLLLHHSSKCPHEDGRCQVTPHCADMKKLWKHMARCTDNNCPVSHCFSSRSILSHYRKCKDARCPACGPVRDTVRKSQQKQSSNQRTQSSSESRRLNGSASSMSMMNNMMCQELPSAASNMSSNMSSLNDPMSFNQQPSSQSSAMPPPSSAPNSSNGMPFMNNNTINKSPQTFQRSNQTMPNQSHPMSSSMQQQQQQTNLSSSMMDPNRSAPPSMMMDTRPNDPLSTSSHNRSSSNNPMLSNNDANLNSSSMQASSNSESSKTRHKQQRLLLLRHASKCQYEKGQCPITPHCAEMKVLWKHIASCKDQHCNVRHCMSSRYVLSHYRRCKDPRCAACGPVRDTIRKSQERSKQQQQQQQLNPRGMAPAGQQKPNPNDQLLTDFMDPMMSSSSTNQQNVAGAASQSLSPALDTSPSGSNPMAFQPKQKRAKTGDSPGSFPSNALSSANASSNNFPSQDACSALPPISSAGDPFAIKTEDINPPQSSTLSSASNDPTNISTPVPMQTDATVSSAAVASLSSTNAKDAPLEKVSSSAPTSVTSSSTAAAAPSTMPTKPAEKEKPPEKPAEKPAEDHSLINSFTIEQIKTHIDSLNRTQQLPPAKLKSRTLEVLKGLQTHQHGWVFNCPVDPVELGLHDYFDIIKRPMDLGTIQKKIESGSYHAIEDFAADVRLTFDNAMLYNEENSVVHDMAKELKAKFTKDYGTLLASLEAEESERRKNDKACSLCGCEKLLFEPPVFFCNGLSCPTSRIRRNTHFYVGGNKQYFFCNQCYNELDENVQIDMGDMTLKKSELKKRKNDEVHEESWVQCDDCNRWIHQICGLFNTRQNKEHKSEYRCPQCLLEKRKADPKTIQAKPLGAEDLPRTKLSEWLERHVTGKVEEQKNALLKEKAESENMSEQDALKALGESGPIIIRQVTSTDRKLDVRERMKRRYAHKNYPDEFPFRCKCIVVFQKLDGVDVILFALYVYEHGASNPAPNARSVYISYLDSVHFMRPRKLRTFVYHEILISYLDYARLRGFATAHIWACPPLKGDDYIFYAKPEDQKTPKDGRLRQWYIDMLVECQKRDVVGKVTNMYDLYFANEKLDATAVPYHEGDYFPGEAENIIKDIEEGGSKKGGSSGKKSKKKRNSSSGSGNKSKSKSKTGRSGTRSGSNEDDEKMEVVEPSYKEGGRDQVMVKLGDTIQPMKESFIVAFLNWKGAKEEDMVVPKEIAEYREKAKKNGEESDKDDASSSKKNRKRDASGNPRASSLDSTSPKDLVSKTATDRNGHPVKIIDDDMDEMDCEFFNNRQAFLNLCRGNHYQFDELRRSKHTSMMVLWHLHNRDAPKFVQQCACCSREILTGIRHHCNTCTDFDLCDECFKNPNTDRGVCNHKLEAIPVEGEKESQSSTSGFTEAQRKERQKNIRLHIQLIEHASRCKSSSCKSSNCAKMKSYLKHGQTCKLKTIGGCKICKRIWTLLRIHAQQCKSNVCPIPQCIAIRERIRQLTKQQQAMDDRRRQEMNRHYRHGMTDSR